MRNKKANIYSFFIFTHYKPMLFDKDTEKLCENEKIYSFIK